VVQIVGANSTCDGTIVNYTDYDAYGNAITQSGGSINPGGMSNGGVSTDISTSFAFGAGYLDASNLTYLVHRYLDNETGQFISVDPLVDQTREAYVYAGDGPIANIDTNGMQHILGDNSTCIRVEQLPWKARLCVQIDTFPTLMTNELSKPQEHWTVDSGKIASIGASRIGMQVCGSHGKYPGHPRNCRENANTRSNVTTTCGTNICSLDGPMYVSSEVNWEAAWVFDAWIQWDGGPKLTKKVSLHETPLCRLGNGGSHVCEPNWSQR